MSNMCVHCIEAWDFDDYVCPCCGQSAIDTGSDMEPTLQYVGKTEDGKRVDMNGDIASYDVIRLSTDSSVFDEPGNYLSEED